MSIPAARTAAFRVILALLAALVSLPQLAGAQTGRGSGSRSASGVSLDMAVERAHQRGGRILSAETVSRDGRRVHLIKLLTEDGRVRSLAVDAQTGERLSSGSARDAR